MPGFKIRIVIIVVCGLVTDFLRFGCSIPAPYFLKALLSAVVLSIQHLLNVLF